MQSDYTSNINQILTPTARRSSVPFYKDIVVGLLLLATPFLLFPRGFGQLALLALPVILIIRWVSVGSLIPRTPLDWPILIILCSVLISIWATFDLGFSIGKIAGLLLGILIFYVVIDLAQSETALGRMITLFIFSGVGLALVAALGTRWTPKFFLLQPLLAQVPFLLQGVRQAESGFNPNQVGGALVLFVPLQLMWLWYWLKGSVGWTQSLAEADRQGEPKADHESRVSKAAAVWPIILTGGSLLITAGILALSQSRGAIGGLLVGLVLIAASRTRWGKVLAGLGLIAVIAAVRLDLLSELVGSGLETETIGTISLTGRLEIWSRALVGLSEFPLGMGMNNFRRVMPVLYPAFSSLPVPVRDVAHAHNHFLQAGLDLGLPGLIAYIAVWLGAAFLLIQTIRQAGSQIYRTVALGLAGGLTAYFVYGLTDTIALGAKPGFVFWWALALVVATHQLSYHSGHRK
jgi:putative inorganic carbon (HCO3(-)) transporter